MEAANSPSPTTTATCSSSSSSPPPPPPPSSVNTVDLEPKIDLSRSSVPKEKGWLTSELHLYQGFWSIPEFLPSVISAQRDFKAQEHDIVLASVPKSGTTWLKALSFAVLNRHRYPDLSHSPLLTSSPHDLVPFYEFQYPKVELLELVSPRLFATHLPYQSLSESIKQSENVRIIYICRNPCDIFISSWKFYSANRDKSLGDLSLNDALDMFCRGVTNWGPIWDHVLGYRKESLRRPWNLLVLMYEDLKDDISSQIKRLAEFMGVPFSLEEEKAGLVDEIAKLCSFSNLRELDVNKNGTFGPFENKTFFRRGEVGDWVNHLTPKMADRLRKVVQEKFDGSGIIFRTGGRVSIYY